MDLGTKRPDPTEPVSPAATKDKEKLSYPSFNINDKVFEAFKKDYPDAKVGDEITVTAKLKISGHREDEYGKSVTFDVTNIEDLSGGAEGEEDDEDKAEEKVLGYKRTKTKPVNEIPPASAKDLED